MEFARTSLLHSDLWISTLTCTVLYYTPRTRIGDARGQIGPCFERPRIVWIPLVGGISPINVLDAILSA